MGYYVEHARELFERRGNMIPLDALTGKTGFRSVYALCEQDAEIVKEAKNSKGLSRFPVYSEELFMDFDNGADEAKKWFEWAKGRDFTATLYESGSKGYHLEILTIPHFGQNVPYSQQMLIKRLGAEADFSLYRHGSLYRLPGTKHKKTGRIKKVVDGHMGNRMLDYRLMDAPKVEIAVDYDEDCFEMALIRILTLYRMQIDPRESRTQKLFGICKELQKSGISMEAVYEIAHTLNVSWGDRAKDEGTIRRVAKEAFK